MQGNCSTAMANLSEADLSEDNFLGANLDDEWPRLPPRLVTQLPLPNNQVSVIVPVRNEAETLAKTLLALASQIDFEGQPLDPGRYEVIVLANNCTDGSAAIAYDFAQQHPQFQLHVVEQTLGQGEAHVGRVRQILMDEAYSRLRTLGQPQGIIASTDGDSQCDRQWIAAMLYEIGQGADAVGGRTVTHRLERAALDQHTRNTYLRFVGYRHLIKQLEDVLDPDPFDRAPRHYQFFGANFAVTAEMYAQAGGMPAVPTGEDVAFRQALLRAGARVRHSPLMRVTTSARQRGRAALGLADRLTQFQTLGQRQQSFLVESAAAIEARVLARRDLHCYWRQYSTGQAGADLAPLSARLALPLTDLQRAIEQSTAWGDLYQRVEQCQQTAGLWQQRWAAVAIERAIAELRLRLNDLRHTRQGRTVETVI